jgi:hypothetical protein
MVTVFADATNPNHIMLFTTVLAPQRGFGWLPVAGGGGIMAQYPDISPKSHNIGASAQVKPGGGKASPPGQGSCASRLLKEKIRKRKNPRIL